MFAFSINSLINTAAQVMMDADNSIYSTLSRKKLPTPLPPSRLLPKLPWQQVQIICTQHWGPFLCQWAGTTSFVLRIQNQQVLRNTPLL